MEFHFTWCGIEVCARPGQFAWYLLALKSCCCTIARCTGVVLLTCVS
jgi:hypothetical protein